MLKALNPRPRHSVKWNLLNINDLSKIVYAHLHRRFCVSNSYRVDCILRLKRDPRSGPGGTGLLHLDNSEVEGVYREAVDCPDEFNAQIVKGFRGDVDGNVGRVPKVGDKQVGFLAV